MTREATRLQGPPLFGAARLVLTRLREERLREFNRRLAMSTVRLFIALLHRLYVFARSTARPAAESLGFEKRRAEAEQYGDVGGWAREKREARRIVNGHQWDGAQATACGVC